MTPGTAVRFPAAVRDSLFYTASRPPSEAHLTFIQWAAWALTSRVNIRTLKMTTKLNQVMTKECVAPTPSLPYK